MKKILFIFNAKAGKAAIGNHLLEVIEAFERDDSTITVMTTKYSGHATEIVKQCAADYDMLLTSGGDGTVNEIVNGLLAIGKKIPVAYIPTGTTNDYAKSLGLPTDITKCIEKISNGETFVSDVGKFQDRAFVYVACFGAPARVTYTTPQQEKNFWGYPAYVKEFLKALPDVKPYHLKVTSEEGVREGDFIFGFVTNSYCVSGFRGVTGKNVSLNDGLFEVTLIKNVQNAVEFAELLGAMGTLFSDSPDPRFIERFAASDIRVESEEELEWNVDGECGGRHADARITVLNDAVTFMV